MFLSSSTEHEVTEHFGDLSRLSCVVQTLAWSVADVESEAGVEAEAGVGSVAAHARPADRAPNPWFSY